jgi:SAUR family protein
MIRGFILYAMYSRALINLARFGFLEIPSKMHQLIRLLPRVTERSRQNSDTTKNGNIVPKGSLPVDVGRDNLTRFVIDVSVLNHPLFAELLEASVEEFGYEHQRVLRIPCDVFLFERILNLINSRHPAL